jgi:hypothetical protein
MTPIWVAAGVLTAGVVGVLAWRGRGKSAAEPEMTEREAHLARHVANRVRCTVFEALPSVRNELALAPNADDETLAKRAAYHYQMGLPEKPCGVYRDGARG